MTKTKKTTLRTIERLRDRRNLTPDQLALVMGRHYNRTKAHPSSRPGNDHKSPGHQKVDREFRTTSEKLAADYGVSDLTIQRAGKFAAAVETLKAGPATTATRTNGDRGRAGSCRTLPFPADAGARADTAGPRGVRRRVRP